MKKIYTLVTILAASFAANAQAFDSFDYTGALTDNGWNHHSGNTTGEIITSTGSLSYTGITSVGNKAVLSSINHFEDVNLVSTNPITTTAYLSSIINVVDGTDLGSGDYFIGFGKTAGTSLTDMYARVFVKTGSTPNTFNLGLVNAAGTGTSPTYDSTDLPFGTPVFIIAKYDITNGTASLWINQTVGITTEPTATLINSSSTATFPTALLSLFLRNGGSTGNIEVDEVILADNWGAVNYANMSTKENNIEGLNIFPNPADEVLNITSNSTADKNVQLFDLTGKKVLDVTTVSTVNVSSLKAGIYVAKINEAGKTATRKVIIK